ncbi:hypothetical protein, partial [Pseudomonas sp. TSRC2-2]|uniref:hypothetical protein n=2 Tax=Pseudomonas TaxID=286 RepID=UPI003CF8C13C
GTCSMVPLGRSHQRQHVQSVSRLPGIVDCYFERGIQYFFDWEMVLMRIDLQPIRSDAELSVVRIGDALVVNGETFDFSPIQEGDTLPATAISSSWFAGQVDRKSGELEITIFLPLPINFSPEQAYPEPLLSVPEGVVSLPQPLADPEQPTEAAK